VGAWGSHRRGKPACHGSTKTTKLSDRRDDELTLDEVERIAI
jgi:hypothetical protein